jgi:hypothetical protein
MGWLRLDDAFGTHPKIAGLTDRAFRGHVMGMLYAAQHLTDGFVPDAMAPKPRILAELERVVLWSPAPGGWVIHDYLDYNPSKADAMARAMARAKAGAKGAASRWHDRGNAPVPTPTPPQQQKKPSTPRKRDVIADALARAEGGDPLEVPSTYMRTLVVKAHELRQIAPNVTPDEVLRRAANWPSHMHDATMTGPAIVKHWARLAHTASPNGKEPPRSYDHARANDEIQQALEETRRQRG